MFPENIAGILQLDPMQFDRHWAQIDGVIGGLATTDEQIAAWASILDRLQQHPVSKGMPHFRLAVLHLLKDFDSAVAIGHLESAYQEDQHYGPDQGKLPQRMGAYRLLALTKGFLEHLQGGGQNWEREQLEAAHRSIVIRTLLAVYDRSLVHILDLEGHTYQSFFQIIQDRSLARFAIENYFCAERLIEAFFVPGTLLSRFTDEYPLSRGIVGLFGGVLEAILADRLPAARGQPLGTLIKEAHTQGIIKVGTKLAALSSMMLYLRNHVHPDRDAKRTAYFIDINVAKGSKVALDWVIADLLRTAP
jgi:hypothetical protein